MGIKAENDQLHDQLKFEQDTFKRLKSDSIHNHTESEKVNEDLRKRLKTAEEICAKQKSTSVLKQTELENLNNNLRGKLKRAEETCKNQAAVQEILADLFQKPRSNVADSETLPTPTKRSMLRDDQPDSKSKLPKLSHTPRGSPTPTPIGATTPSISDACNDKEGRLPPSAPRTILRNKHGKHSLPPGQPSYRAKLRPTPKLLHTRPFPLAQTTTNKTKQATASINESTPNPTRKLSATSKTRGRDYATTSTSTDTVPTRRAKTTT